MIAKTLAATATMIMLLASCKKDHESTTSEKIAGKWLVETAISNDVSNGVTTTVTYTGQSSDYIDFRADGKVYTSVNGTLDTSAYSIGTDKITFTDLYPTNAVTVYQIRALTNNSMQLYNRNDLSATHYTEATANLKK